VPVDSELQSNNNTSQPVALGAKIICALGAELRGHGRTGSTAKEQKRTTPVRRKIIIIIP